MRKWRAWSLLKVGVDTLTKVASVMREELEMTPAKRRAKEVASAAAAAAKWKQHSSASGNSNASAVVLRERRVPWWERQWESLKSRAMNTWLMRRLRRVPQHPLVAKGQEIAEDLRDQWETSDHPVVHRIQDLNESLFGETATAMAYKEIRRRDPDFSLTDFVAEVQEDLRPILEAYLKGDLQALSAKCSPAVVERCQAERRVLQAQGLKAEDRILHISDLELRETKLLGNNPIIILSFRTQQTHCVVDRFGVVTEGGRDDILSVFHLWALQQGSQEEIAEINAALATGSHALPKWRLREMQQLGMQALI